MAKVFISYSWDNEEHNNWVKNFAARLISDGVEVTLDQWHLAYGDQLPKFMENSIRENNYILIICTPNYKVKSDKRTGGVGYEGDIMTAEIFVKNDDRKFIPILRESEWLEVAPSWLLGKKYVDLRENSRFQDNSYKSLLLHINDIRLKSPVVGDRFERTIGQYDQPFEFLNSGVVNISGQWIDSANFDTIYFKQINNIVVGIYNFGSKRKIGALIGKINKQIFEFEWKWFELEYKGYGRMKVANQNTLVIGIWWYENKENLIEHVGYRYVSKEMPKWLTENDFEEFNTVFII